MDWSSSTTRMSAMVRLGQPDVRARAPGRPGLETDAAAVPFHDGLDVDEPEPDTFGLGGDERVEHALGERRIDADAVVADPDPHRGSLAGSRAYFQNASSVHRLRTVDEQ